MRLSEWFFVKWDDEEVSLHASPPGGSPWKHGFKWKNITRICYKAEGLEMSDGIYIFTSDRPESYVVPVEASGGGDFWAEIISRDLFDAQRAIEAACAQEGLFCWPED